MLHLLALSSVVAYLVACWLYLKLLWGVDKVTRSGRIVLSLAGLCHAIFLERIFIEGDSLVGSTALSVVAFVIVVLYLIFDLWLRNGMFGVFVAPLAAILMLSSGVLYHIEYSVDSSVTAHSPILNIHVGTSIGALALLALGFVWSLAIVSKERSLRLRRFPVFLQKLPPLEALEKLCWRFIMAGFVLMVGGMLSGFYLVMQLSGPALLLDPHLLWSLFSVFVYSVLVFVRSRLGWRGREAAYLNIAGFVTILVLLFTLGFTDSSLKMM